MADLPEILNGLEIKENINTLKFNYKWSIDKNSLNQGSTGERINSSECFIEIFNDKITCFIVAYPKGRIFEGEDYLSLYLYLESSKKKDLMVKNRISILNAKNEEINVKEGEKQFTQLNKYYGWLKFITRKYLLADTNKLFINDKLTIFCKVTITVDNSDMTTCSEFQLADELGILFENKNLCDVTLSVVDQKFQAHKAILTARSPVFAAMFEHDMKENKQHRVDITDVDAEVMQEMLKFIYTDKADVNENIVGRLLAAANKYGLKGLKLMCEQVLCNKLTINNVAENLIFADLHSADQLKGKAHDIISTHANDATNTRGWKSMMQYPHLMTELIQVLANRQNLSTLNELEIKENINLIKFNYAWSIDKNSLNQIITGEALNSSHFFVDIFYDKVKCYLVVDPQGNNSTSIDCLLLYLHLESTQKKDLMPTCTLSILNAKYKEIHEMKLDHKFTQGEKRWSFSQIINRNFLLDDKNELLSNDIFTIFYTVTLTVDNLNIPSSEFQLANELGVLFKNENLSDVTLSVADQEFQAHKAILSARSPVFAAMFEHDMKENKQHTVDITDVDAEVIQEMLQFIYTAKADISEEIVNRLLAAADKYDLKTLMQMCEEVLCNKLTIINVAENLILADLHSANKLKRKALDIISTHSREATNTLGWKSMIQYPHLMEEVIQMLVRLVR